MFIDGIPKLFLLLIEHILELSINMIKDKISSPHSIINLTLELSKISLGILKTSDALETKINEGILSLSTPK